MTPSEATILTNFLVTPAPLNNFKTLADFTAIFPPKYRDNATIKEMYRMIQHERAKDVEDVRRRIRREVKKGEEQQDEVKTIRRQQERVNDIDMVGYEMETELYDYSRDRIPHSLQTIHPTLEDASDSTAQQIAELEAEIETAQREAREIIGELSDLRYGRFPKPTAGGDDIREEIISTLRLLESASAGVEHG